MSELLYLVHCNMRPTSLATWVDIISQPGKGLKPELEATWRAYRTEIQRHIPTFDDPHLILFADGGVSETTDGLYGVGRERDPQYIIDNVVAGVSLDAFIDGVLQRERPITAIVEFSMVELYPSGIAQLARRYKVQTVDVPRVRAADIDCHTL